VALTPGETATVRFEVVREASADAETERPSTASLTGGECCLLTDSGTDTATGALTVEN
jgi:hypothetical protein